MVSPSFDDGEYAVMGDFIMDSDLAKDLSESPEDAARRFAGYLQRIEAAVKQFPTQRLADVPGWNTVDRDEFTVLSVQSLLEELYRNRYNTPPTTEQAPSVHKEGWRKVRDNPQA